MSAQTITLVVTTGFVAFVSLYFSPLARSHDAFFKGYDRDGRQPSMLALTFSQVTTWIFARSIMNAAILGYFYGIGGALAYAAYYLSFLTGAWIIDSLRFRHGYNSVQEFLHDRFGLTGTTTYNFLVGVRLLSEVFANLLVIGLIFGADGSIAYTLSIMLVGVVALFYSLQGGLHASIKTDTFQAGFFLILLVSLLIMTLISGNWNIPDIVVSTPNVDNPGWVLLGVAFLQVWSYPLHDPVMMDRGFIADRKTTLSSFYHAGWIATLCILAFGFIGVWAGLNKIDGETVIPTLSRLLGEWPLLMFNVALIVSCMSTLDSAFSSTAKLTVVDMKFGKNRLLDGRIAMAAFLAGGLVLVFFGSKDLFSAVAVSGTASMFLAPVVFFSLWMGRDDIPLWSYVIAFISAMAAALLYFTESSGYTGMVREITGLEHKYSYLLVLCVLTLMIGCGSFLLGMLLNKRKHREFSLISR